MAWVTYQSGASRAARRTSTLVVGDLLDGLKLPCHVDDVHHYRPRTRRMRMGRPGLGLGTGPVASRPILGAMGRPISLDAMASMAHWVVWVDPNIFLQS